MNEQHQTFNIQFVSNITGINPHTIRAWEKRYNAICPERDSNGRRLYSNEEIERLNKLNKLVKMGNSISDIAGLPSTELTSISEQYGITEHRQNKYVDFDFDQSLQNLSMALSFFKLDVLNHELDKASQSLTSIVFALKIVQPVIDQIRNIKMSESLSENQRTQIFMILKSQLNKKIYRTTESPEKNKKHIIVAAPMGKFNEVGSMVATIIFLDMGYNVDFIGGDVQADILGQMIAQFKPDCLFIGMNYSHFFNEAQSTQYLKSVCQYTTPTTKIMIGAYDFCMANPELNVECFNSYEKLYDHIKDL